MARMEIGEAYRRLRQAFPELPEYCKSVRVDMAHHEAPQIMCIFYPSEQANAMEATAKTEQATTPTMEA